MPNATHHDADIVLRVFELRREPQMREARNYILFKFWPRSADEIIAMANAIGKTENQHLRQVFSFAEMCASLPLHGAVNPDLFLDWNSELIFLYAKFKPFLAEMREKFNPGWLMGVEKFINSSPTAKERLEKTIPRANKMAEAAHGK